MPHQETIGDEIVQTRPHALDAKDFLVVESIHMDGANADGTITVPAGDKAILIEFDPQASYLGRDFVPGENSRLHAVSASDANALEYELTVGEDTICRTQSPLGVINDPYSFVRVLGQPLEISDYVRYTAINTGGTDIDAVGRFHVQE